MTKTNPDIDWTKAPTEAAVWCAALKRHLQRYEGWHEKRPNGDYSPVGPDHISRCSWLKCKEGVLFEVHYRPVSWHETGDLPPVGGTCVDGR